jgi:hypothetical protein
MKTRFTIAFLIIFLTSCTPSPAIPVDAQNTAMVAVQTYIALTQTAAPTPTVIPTATSQATLIPTLPPPPILTPDAVQVERWREYETALAKSILPMFEYLVLCEWDILGRSEQEVYVWAACRAPGGDDSRPVVIRLGMDGAIQEVEVLKRSTSSNVDELFPKEVQEKFNFYVQMYGFDGRLRELYDHLIYRETHPETPPLVVLSSTAFESTVTPIYPTPSPLPTQPLISIFTPDAIQIERWREYQTELAKKLVSKFPVEIVLCEWDILGRSEQEVYVWAVCTAPGYLVSKPAVIYFKTDGAIQDVEIAVYGSTWDSDLQRLFPEDVQEKIASGIFLQRSVELKNHIELRRTHLEEPPLIVISAMPALTSTP